MKATELKQELLDFLEANNNFGLEQPEEIVDSYLFVYKEGDKLLNEKNKSDESAVEWLEQELDINFEIRGNSFLFDKILKQAKEIEVKQRGYSEEQVREMLFMALYEPQGECCTTHTKDSIVRKVLKTFKSE